MLADFGSRTDCQQGGLLQFGSRWHLLYRLQFVMNAAARLIFLSEVVRARITPLLRELHWLRVPERVIFRLCDLAYRCLHGTAPAYLAESPHSTSDVDTRGRLRSADSHASGIVHQTFNTR